MSLPARWPKLTKSRISPIPGLGVRNADRILQVRRWHQLRLADLARLRVPMKKTLPSSSSPITRRTCSKVPGCSLSHRLKQLELFAPKASVFSGQL